MHQKGFTLVELLVVLALIAILAAILIVIINPAEIFKRGRDTQREGDLRNLSAATDAYLSEMALNSSLTWPTCNNVYFSVTTTGNPTGWPATTTATGTTSRAVDGTGWVPLKFNLVGVLNLTLLPLDPRNGQSGADAAGTSTVFAYSFACNTSNSYEYAAKLESSANNSLMQNDGGNQSGLYEVGPSRNILY